MNLTNAIKETDSRHGGGSECVPIHPVRNQIINFQSDNILFAGQNRLDIMQFVESGHRCQIIYVKPQNLVTQLG